VSECMPVRRPERLFDPATTVQGLRAAGAVLAGGVRTLRVFLYHDPPPVLADPAAWMLTPPPGGAPVAVGAASIAAAPAPHVELTLDGSPELGRYRLAVAPPAGVEFDPLRTWLAVRLRPECPDLGPCWSTPPDAPAAPGSPVTDYLARDWRSLRVALVEQLLRESPDADLSTADPTITLIELFAHEGDLLHYRLDRVATEAYLETARLRTSVRRHSRLVDFTLAEAVSARAAVHVSVPPGGGAVPVRAGDVAVDQAGSAIAFALEADLPAQDALGEIAVYDWGEESCRLAAGATEGVLVRPTPADPLGAAWLAPGDLLAFEVVDAGDPDEHGRWSRREQAWPIMAPEPAFRTPLASRTAQVVRLTAVEPVSDPLMGAALELFQVRWAPADALQHDYATTIDSSAGAGEVTVARGNVVPAHHGRPVDGPPGTALVPRPRPDGGPSHEFDLVLAGAPGRRGHAGGPGLAADETGRPHGMAIAVGLPSGIAVGAEWVPTLLESGGDFPFVVDAEEHEPPVLRFRTGAVGSAPPLGSTVAGRYEVGGGAAGNVAANALSLLERNTSPPGQAPGWQVQPVSARNPVAAVGGADPVPLAVARRDAPEAYAAVPRRAVLPADHAAAAAANPLVDRASARRGWSGSWPLITTVVDLLGEDGDAREQVRLELDGLRMLGTEVAVVEGAPVGVLLALALCLTPAADSQAVRAAALRALRGVRVPLGGALYVSAAIAAVAGLPGVDAVEVTEARRLDEPAGTVRTVIEAAPDEVLVLDDDPARPERGRIDVTVRGSR
jgi:hypothetical protein